MAEKTDKNTVVVEKTPTVTFTLDGREVTVPKGTTILLAAQSVGIDIPTLCWHPKLTIAGSCRMCYVEIEKWPKLAISCATEAMDGMVVYTDSDLVRKGRAAVIQFTLMNHPLDCPTCDKGGECTLQDLAFAYGVDNSEFDFGKHRFGATENDTTFDDVVVGPEIVLNRNRCIRCYRCIRANKEAFGEFDLGVFERGNHTEINVAPGRRLDNPFSGNLTEVCPVGALTHLDWRYKIRVWLTDTTSSICPFYSSGSNILLYTNQQQNKIYRATSRVNDDIDDGWLSDTTRFGYQVAMSPDRLKMPLIKKDGKQVEATWEEALKLIGKRLTEITEKKGRVCIGGLVASSQDNATLFSFSKLLRKVVGSNNIDFRTDYRMLPQTSGGAYDVLCSQPFSIVGINQSDVIVTLGSDLVKEHPNEYLRIRKAVNFGAVSVYAMNPYRTKSSDVAKKELVYQAGTEEILINSICLVAIEDGLIDSSLAGNLAECISPSTAAESAELCEVNLEDIRAIARALADGRQITFFAGEIVGRSINREAIAAALCNLHRLFGLSGRCQMNILPRHANSCGAVQLGLLPAPVLATKDMLSKLWGGWPESEPQTTDRMMANMKKDEIDGYMIVGANPIMLYPDREFATDALEGLDFLMVADLFETETTALADVVLPLASWAEYSGEYVNLEGRVQKTHQALKTDYDARPGYEIAALIAQQLEQPLFENDQTRDETITKVLAVDSTLPWPDEFLEVKHVADEVDEEYPLVLFVGDDSHHSGYLTEKSNSLTNFQAEPYVEISPTLAKRLGIDDGDSVRVESPVGKIVVPVRISHHINNDVVFVPMNFSGKQVNSLIMRKSRVDRVRISKVVD
ncbi:MAG: NADH-quinone oxidoreductase subunit NuoG [candidate division Zixibacteria bacterium]|nr:NADH-quinone oxidoreductase subunit NuoG [candidate division Zixibacteria bacterium]